MKILSYVSHYINDILVKKFTKKQYSYWKSFNNTSNHYTWKLLSLGENDLKCENFSKSNVLRRKKRIVLKYNKNMLKVINDQYKETDVSFTPSTVA